MTTPSSSRARREETAPALVGDGLPGARGHLDARLARVRVLRHDRAVVARRARDGAAVALLHAQRNNMSEFAAREDTSLQNKNEEIKRVCEGKA